MFKAFTLNVQKMFEKIQNLTRTRNVINCFKTTYIAFFSIPVGHYFWWFITSWSFSTKDFTIPMYNKKGYVNNAQKDRKLSIPVKNSMTKSFLQRSKNWSEFTIRTKICKYYVIFVSTNFREWPIFLNFRQISPQKRHPLNLWKNIWQ